MEQKFVKFEEAIDKLGITAERLNQLREDGELRAYRDGASWKFRADDIDRMASDGVPEPAPPSDVGLVDRDELVDASPLEKPADLDDDFGLADLDDDTVTAGASDPSLPPLADEPSDPSDSILLSEETLGESSSAPPSTIIGKSELESEDADLNLVTDEGSDVKLTPGTSNVFSSGVAGSGVLDDAEKDGGHTSAFEKLEELEIDLAAESSRILSPDDMAGMQDKSAAAGKKPAKEGDSDLTLKDVDLAGEDEGTDPVPEELEKASGKSKKAKDAGPTSDLELATGDDDDFVLAEAGGSDITLDSGDSGINLIDPSDSGLALDDIPLEMGGSAILESLSLGGDSGESEISLVGSDVQDRAPKPSKPAKGGKQAAALQTDDDFRLTPLGDGDEEGDSSSQVIPTDEDFGAIGAGDAGILGADAFAEDVGDDVGVAEDYAATGDADGFDVSPYAGAVAPRADVEYSVGNLVALGSCAVLLLFGFMVSLDVMRNIWSWDSNLALNDTLIDSVLGLMGKR